MIKLLPLIFIAILFGLTACEPTNKGWESLATVNGKPVKRSSCVIHYKINKDRFPNGGSDFGINIPGEITRAAGEMQALTGIRWIYDGYTSATIDNANGKQWATNNGVLIELRTRNWSQPYPSKGPAYTGGAIWYDVEFWKLLSKSQPNDFRKTILGTIRHEMGHQHGLGDIYNNGWPYTIVNANRMGTSRNPWGAGDKQGFNTLRPVKC